MRSRTFACWVTELTNTWGNLRLPVLLCSQTPRNPLYLRTDIIKEFCWCCLLAFMRGCARTTPGYDLLFSILFLAFPSGIADFDCIVLVPPFELSFRNHSALWSPLGDFRSFIYLNSLPEMYFVRRLFGGDSSLVSPGLPLSNRFYKAAQLGRTLTELFTGTLNLLLNSFSQIMM